MKKISSLLGAVAVLAALSAGVAFAQTSTGVTPVVSPLSGQVALGSSGADVTNLQTFLATNPTVYPEGLVTGFYGVDTEAAVMRFQEAYGISPVGFVGPATLAELNSLISAGAGMTGANLADITTGATSTIAGTTTTTTTTTSTGTPQTFTSTGMPAITNVQVAPYNAGTNTTGTESSVLTWNVSEPSQSYVFYLNSSGALVQSTATASTGFSTNAQSAILTNLNPGTTYTFLIASSDEAGNAGITYPSSFTVDASGDVTATINSAPNLNTVN